MCRGIIRHLFSCCLPPSLSARRPAVATQFYSPGERRRRRRRQALVVGRVVVASPTTNRKRNTQSFSFPFFSSSHIQRGSACLFSSLCCAGVIKLLFLWLFLSLFFSFSLFFFFSSSGAGWLFFLPFSFFFGDKKATNQQTDGDGNGDGEWSVDMRAAHHAQMSTPQPTNQPTNRQAPCSRVLLLRSRSVAIFVSFSFFFQSANGQLCVVT